MTREEAARVLEEKVEVWEGVLKHMLPAGDYSELKQIEDYETALRMGAAALRGPEWVRTADRFPTKADTNSDLDVIAVYDDREEKEQYVITKYWKYVRESPEQYPYWMPFPKLPEEEK